jgi:hypothetical protein
MPELASNAYLPLLRDLVRMIARDNPDLKWAGDGMPAGDPASAAAATDLVGLVSEAVIERPAASAADIAGLLRIEEALVRVAFLVLDHAPEPVAGTEVEDEDVVWWQPRAHDRLLAALRERHAVPPADVVEPANCSIVRRYQEGDHGPAATGPPRHDRAGRGSDQSRSRYAICAEHPKRDVDACDDG